jgi:transposase-like protein
MSKTLPKTLVEAIKYFDDPDVCVQYIADIRWPGGPVCPTCSGTEHSYLTTRRLWKCKACKRQFSVKVGTIFEDSSIKLKNWLTAIWLICNSKNGISSYELGRAIGVQQRSAWFMEHRIRLAMQMGSFDRITGEIEVDETFVGGKARNMHKDVRKRKITGTGGKDKTIVVGARERGGKVRATVVPDRSGATLVPFVRDTGDGRSDGLHGRARRLQRARIARVQARSDRPRRGLRPWTRVDERHGELLELAQAWPRRNIRRGQPGAPVPLCRRARVHVQPATPERLRPLPRRTRPRHRTPLDLQRTDHRDLAAAHAARSA